MSSLNILLLLLLSVPKKAAWPLYTLHVILNIRVRRRISYLFNPISIVRVQSSIYSNLSERFLANQRSQI